MRIMLIMPVLAFPAVRPLLLWPQLAQEGWDASRKEPDGRWSDWKYSNLEAKSITLYRARIFAPKTVCFASWESRLHIGEDTKGRREKIYIYFIYFTARVGGVSHLGPDRKEMWKFWPIFSIVFWFFDTQNTLHIIVRGLKHAFFSVLNDSAILLFDGFVTEQQQTVCRKNWGY